MNLLLLPLALAGPPDEIELAKAAAAAELAKLALKSPAPEKPAPVPVFPTDPSQPAPSGYEWRRYSGQEWKLYPVENPRPFPESPTTRGTAAPNVLTSPRPDRGLGSSGASWQGVTFTNVRSVTRGGFTENCPPSG